MGHHGVHESPRRQTCRSRDTASPSWLVSDSPPGTWAADPIVSSLLYLLLLNWHQTSAVRCAISSAHHSTRVCSTRSQPRIARPGASGTLATAACTTPSASAAASWATAAKRVWDWYTGTLYNRQTAPSSSSITVSQIRGRQPYLFVRKILYVILVN
jgi:hypothetical protein